MAKTAGELLKKWRGDNNLSQGQAADLLAMSQSSLSDYESGESTPRIAQIVRIAALTKGLVPAEAWVAGAKASKPSKARRGRRTAARRAAA
jgi:transcriptional regulator with XRE-family HTH domain